MSHKRARRAFNCHQDRVTYSVVHAPENPDKLAKAGEMNLPMESL
jgi:hypothetical protein